MPFDSIIPDKTMYEGWNVDTLKNVVDKEHQSNWGGVVVKFQQLKNYFQKREWLDTSRVLNIFEEKLGKRAPTERDRAVFEEVFRGAKLGANTPEFYRAQNIFLRLISPENRDNISPPPPPPRSAQVIPFETEFDEIVFEESVDDYFEEIPPENYEENEQDILDFARYESFCADKIEPHYRINSVPADGDCFFYALSAQVYPGGLTRNGVKLTSEQVMKIVRHEISEYMKHNSEKYLFFVFNETENSADLKSTYDEHVKQIGLSAAGDESHRRWGSHLHCRVAADLYQCSILVYDNNDPDFGKEKDGVGRPLPGHADGYRFENPTTKSEPIRMLYNGVNHWEWVSPK